MEYLCRNLADDEIIEIEADDPQQAAELFFDNYIVGGDSDYNGIEIEVLDMASGEVHIFQVEVRMEPVTYIVERAR